MGKKAVFIGGIAVEAYVAYRRTHDVDLLVRQEDLHILKDLLEAEGFHYRRSLHLDKHVFKLREGGEVDAYTETVGGRVIDESFFRRGRDMEFAGSRIRVPSLEALLVLKMLAGREMDLTDIAVLLQEHREEVDTRALEEMAGREILHRTTSIVADYLPAEYGWSALQKLKAWVSDQEWG